MGSRSANRARGQSARDMDTAVDLYWLPLGAGGHSVRFNGLVFEAIAARLQHRTRSDLYHSALEVQAGEARYVIEMAPAWNEPASDRGVVAEGAVASRSLSRWALFRYEIRRWRDGRIPDADKAVESPQRLSHDPDVARRILAHAPDVPKLVWGRDERQAGEMWNSNSVIAWLLSSAGIDARRIQPPSGGRAPGWSAGLVIAQREERAVEVAAAACRRPRVAP